MGLAYSNNNKLAGSAKRMAKLHHRFEYADELGESFVAMTYSTLNRILKDFCANMSIMRVIKFFFRLNFISGKGFMQRGVGQNFIVDDNDHLTCGSGVFL
jgi:hypothetical protein